jgi:hypothetical protein
MAESCATFKESVWKKNNNKCCDCGKTKGEHPVDTSSEQTRMPEIQPITSHPAMAKNSQTAQRQGYVWV